MNEAGGCFSSSVTPWALCEVTFGAAVNACGQPGWPSGLEILQDLSSKKASNLWPAACRTYVTAQYPCHVAQVRSNQLITSSVITGSRCNWTLVLQLWFLLQRDVIRLVGRGKWCPTLCWRARGKCSAKATPDQFCLCSTTSSLQATDQWRRAFFMLLAH